MSKLSNMLTGFCWVTDTTIFSNIYCHTREVPGFMSFFQNIIVDKAAIGTAYPWVSTVRPNREERPPYEVFNHNLYLE
jgi:hypothetical protein